VRNLMTRVFAVEVPFFFFAFAGTLAAFVAAILLPGCLATSGDLQRIADAQARQEQKVSQAVEEYRDGKLSSGDLTLAIRNAASETAAEMKATVSDSLQRAKEAGAGGLQAILGTGLASILAGFFGGKAHTSYVNGSGRNGAGSGSTS
jgi:hypothetical protein